MAEARKLNIILPDDGNWELTITTSKASVPQQDDLHTVTPLPAAKPKPGWLDASAAWVAALIRETIKRGPPF